MTCGNKDQEDSFDSVRIDSIFSFLNTKYQNNTSDNTNFCVYKTDKLTGFPKHKSVCIATGMRLECDFYVRNLRSVMKYWNPLVDTLKIYIFEMIKFYGINVDLDI